ncbi:MAG: hypothetical protein VX871_10540, partial [Pseudomonadota bacterium]|nr:hypothetical protein [Pseudomonadota bacterium]
MLQNQRSLIYVVLLLALAVLAPSTAHAIGSSVPDPKPTSNCPSGSYYSKRCNDCIQTCDAGKIWSCTRKECVKRT